jgi:hypothetical protein
MESVPTTRGGRGGEGRGGWQRLALTGGSRPACCLALTAAAAARLGGRTVRCRTFDEFRIIKNGAVTFENIAKLGSNWLLCRASLVVPSV